MDLALNNLQRLICHKTQQTNQTKSTSTIKQHTTTIHSKNIDRFISAKIRKVLIDNNKCLLIIIIIIIIKTPANN